MKSLCLLILVSFSVNATTEFRGILKEFLKNDPTYQEVELNTPVYDALYYQGLSKLIIPRVTLSYGQNEQKNNVSLATNVDKFQFGSLNASLDIFSFGRDWNVFQANRYAEKAQLMRVESQLMIREAEIADLVLGYLREAKNVEILNRLVKMKEEARQLSFKRLQRGIMSQQDYQKVQLDASNARAELFVAEQRLNTLTAQCRSFAVKTLPTQYPWENDLSEARLNELMTLSTDVSELPQFKEAFLNAESAAYESNAALANMWGDVSFTFTRSYYDFPDAELWEWRTSLVYTLPLFDQFDQSVTRKRELAERQAQEIRQKFEKRRVQEVLLAENNNLKISWKNWLERKEALKISNKLYQSTLGQFNQGKLSVNELFVDQDRLLRTEQIANEALHQLHTSTLAFCHSRGRSYVKGCF